MEGGYLPVPPPLDKAHQLGPDEEHFSEHDGRPKFENTNWTVMANSPWAFFHPPRWGSHVNIYKRKSFAPISISAAEEELGDQREYATKAYSKLHHLMAIPTAFETLSYLESLALANSAPAPKQVCRYIAPDACKRALGGTSHKRCYAEKTHYRRLITKYTDIRLGDCAFLDSCDLIERCPYTHYKSEGAELMGAPKSQFDGLGRRIGEPGIMGMGGFRRANGACAPAEMYPKPQWINCDIRNLDLKLLGKFGVVLADPPWDIRMSLPYGTCSDQAVINLPFEHLQTSGLVFLWCTARTVEAGHSCLKRWGYDFCDEIAWVKVDHLHRLISAGRTGHWLNHTMEHCLVGSKGDTKWVRRGLDVDVIVSQPRATSHKPDELYETIERLVGPHTRKLEVFGREDNLRPGWITIGNQLPPTYIHDPLLKSALQEFSRNPPHTNLGSHYPKDWNPWEDGHDRFGYGEERDWKEERREFRKRKVKRGGRAGYVHRPPAKEGELKEPTNSSLLRETI